MLRRVALMTFALAVALVVACGRQVTPDPTLNNTANPNLAGRMVVRFRTNGTLDFNKYFYAIVFDTCGGGTPYPNTFATSFNNYSSSFLVGGIYGTASATQVQYIITPGSSNSLNPRTVPLGASTTQLNLNSNQQNTEFQLTFVRQQLNNPLQIAQPCPNITPPPGGGAPNSQPTTLAQQLWFVNFFTIDSATNVVQDSLGVGGSQDTTFNGIGIDTNVTKAYAIFRQAGSTLPADQHAAINGGEIDNFM